MTIYTRITALLRINDILLLPKTNFANLAVWILLGSLISFPLFPLRPCVAVSSLCPLSIYRSEWIAGAFSLGNGVNFDRWTASKKCLGLTATASHLPTRYSLLASAEEGHLLDGPSDSEDSNGEDRIIWFLIDNFRAFFILLHQLSMTTICKIHPTLGLENARRG